MPSDEEIIAATRRWIERAVIGLDLCPFARAPFAQQRSGGLAGHQEGQRRGEEGQQEQGEGGARGDADGAAQCLH